MGRPSKGAARMKANRNRETIKEPKEHEPKNCKRNAISRSQESPLARQARLSWESIEQRQHRLDVIH